MCRLSVEEGIEEYWVNLEVFVEITKKNVLSYLVDSVLLFAKLCAGRNIETSAPISKVMTHDLVFSVICNQGLPAQLRTAFCQLYLNLYVDVKPYEKVRRKGAIDKWCAERRGRGMLSDILAGHILELYSSVVQSGSKGIDDWNRAWEKHV